jgi:hypothetical protein
MATTNRNRGIKGRKITAYGWIMNWKPLRSVDDKKLGEEFTVKTVFKKQVGFENVSVYISNVLVRDMVFIEKVKNLDAAPVPVYIEGSISWDKVCTNLYENSIESTKRLYWICLYKRGLVLRIVEKVPDDILQRFSVTVPPFTFKKFFSMQRSDRSASSRPR